MTIETEAQLDDALSEPREQTRAALATCAGDVIVLGAGGKMGPTLARMARRAAPGRRIIAVSRFSSRRARQMLTEAGVDTIECDLLDHRAVASLPDAPNVVYMAGQKFGTTDAPSRTWMMNVVVPAHCAERYAASRIVAFSTGNVYALTPVSSSGSRETDTPLPVGEYAASCLGRERVFEHYAATRGTRSAIVRLNYAIDLRYGVLTDLAVRIRDGVAVPLDMGFVNLIWQRDANRAALELLPHVDAPPLVVNVTGASHLAVRELAGALGARLGRTPTFAGTEAKDALLSDTSRMRTLLGAPEMALDSMLDLVAGWVRNNRPLLGKPTHFETRDGAF
jgi:nucleoside-diphosphate-sugar epimerase